MVQFRFAASTAVVHRNFLPCYLFSTCYFCDGRMRKVQYRIGQLVVVVVNCWY